MATGYVYPGRVVAVDPAGPIVTVPMLAQTARWGPLPSAVPGLEVGEQVIVTSLGTSRDALVIIGRLPGRTPAPGIDDIPGLSESLDAIDTRVDALQIEQTTDHGVLGEHGERLDDLDAGQIAQNNRLTAVEGVNTTQNTRLTTVEGRATSIEGVNTTQNTRLTALENAAPTDTVTDAELAAGLASVRADTVGKVTTKGDLLAGSATSGVLIRQAAGTTDQILTADSTQATGMKWAASPRGLPLSLTGATGPTRYVGATTTAGPPSTGTWQNGDFTIDSVGHVWVRAGGAWKGWTKDLDTRATSLETQATSLDTRLDAQEGNGNHVWTTSGDLANDFNAFVIGWNAGSGNAGIATVDSGGFFRLNRVGRWAITLYGNLDNPIDGYFQVTMNWPNGPMEPTEILVQGEHRQAGYGGCGFSWVHVTWSGWVNSAQSTAPFRMQVYQVNRSGIALNANPGPGVTNARPNYYALVNYMGGA